MKTISVAFGFALVAAGSLASVHAEDASNYLCKASDASCAPHTTDGSIPADPKSSEIVHIASKAAFTIRDTGTAIQLWPASDEWLVQFSHATLQWDAHNLLLPYESCPTPSVPAAKRAKLRAAGTGGLASKYSNFSTQLELHLKADYTPQIHTVYIFPIQPAEGVTAKFCVIIPPHGTELHDGAVHTD